MNKNYPLAVGQADKLRLDILNKMLNPTFQTSLLNSGLKPGMSVLEIGCGGGQMACWVAQQVGPSGKVTAVDLSEEQLEIARSNAKQAGISNIEFVQIDMHELQKLTQKFDFVYGRWVLIFSKKPESVLQSLFDLLNPQGILTYTDTSFFQPGYFSYPESATVDRWFHIVKNNMIAMQLDGHVGIKLYHYFKNIGCKNIKVLAHQPMLITEEEKSTLRLGLLSSQNTLLQNSVLSSGEFDTLVNELKTLEQENILIGFFRNIFVSGIKAI